MAQLIIKRRSIGWHLIPLLLAFAGCAASPPSYKFFGNNTAPAAQGSVTVRAGPNGNSQLAVRVRHLAPPERLVAGATVYVVWVTPLDRGPPQNVGALRLDSSLDGALKTVTPLHDFRLTISVEADPAAAAPTSDPVVSTTVSSKYASR